MRYKVISEKKISSLIDELTRVWRSGFETQRDHRLFYIHGVLEQAKILGEWDKVYSQSKDRPFLFYLLIGLSPQYRNLAELSESLAVQIQFQNSSLQKHYLSFDPTSPICHYYLSQDWARTAPKNDLQQYRFLRSKRHSYMHDLAHMVMARTLIPKVLMDYSAEDIATFFTLQECLVDYLDLVFQQKLGLLSNPLEQTGLVYRRRLPSKEDIDFSTIQHFRYFFEVILQQVIDKRSGKDITLRPKYEAARDSISIQEEFVAKTVGQWEQRVKAENMKKAMLKFTPLYSPASKLKGMRYIDYLRHNRGEQNRVYQYLCDAFLIHKTKP